MPPRVISRTHYQVDEPAYLGILIRECSSPTTSDYSERLAGRLEVALKARHKDFNLPAAKYCVDLAKSLELLTENNFWTWSGHVLNLLRSNTENDALSLDLSVEEQVFYFRLFLEHDGAAVVFLANKAARAECIPEKGEDWNDVANEMMKFIYAAYLDIVADIRDRADIRQLIAKRTRVPYSGKSGSHQCFIHLTLMARVGLLESVGREYRKRLGEIGGALSRFIAEIPDIKTLERTAEKKDWLTLVSRVLSIPDHRGARKWTDVEILRESHEIYAKIMATGVPLCPLNSLIEIIQVKQIAQQNEPSSYDECMATFRHAQRESPAKIKFNVDRMGRPAFISLS